MAFFNVNDRDQVALLPSAVRAHPDLASVASDAEADVLAFFTRRVSEQNGYYNGFYTNGAYNKGDATYVFLRGFNPDVTSVTDAELIFALRRTIVEVVAWRLGKRAEALHLSSVTTALGVGKQVKDDVVHPFPPGAWWYRLRRWDVRPAQYHL